MRLVFEPNCTVVRIEGRVSPDVLDAVDRELTFTEPGAFFTPQYKMGFWDGKRRLFDLKSQTFPPGLIQRVQDCLTRHDIEIDDVVDTRPSLWDIAPSCPRTLPDRTHGMITLHDEQVEAVDTALTEGCGCVQMPTGTGKGELIAATAIAVRPYKTLVIVDRRSLLTQTHRVLEERLQERVGRYGGDWHETRQRVTIATIQSLWQHRDRLRVDFFPHVRVLIVDEAHRISPKMWFRTLAEIPAPVRLGFSATITEATRKMIVEAYLGPIVFEREIDEMAELGRIARGNVAMLRMIGMLGDDMAPDEAYMRWVVRSPERNRKIVQAVGQAAGRPTLVLVVRIEHGMWLQEQFEAVGLHVPFLHGKTPLDVIDRGKRDLGEGRLPVLIASTIFDYGQNIPSIRVLINGGGQRSPLTTIQRVGRSLRAKASGENTVDILDFFDAVHRTLKSQSKERLKTYQRKRFATRIITSLDDWLR